MNFIYKVLKDSWKDLFHTFTLNIAFVAVLPLILSAFTQSLIFPIFYVTAYAFVESIIDEKRYNGSAWDWVIMQPSCFFVNLIFNGVLLFGVSCMIVAFGKFGTQICGLSIVVLIAVLSLIEDCIDRKMYVR